MKKEIDFEEECKRLTKELRKSQTGHKLQVLQLKSIMRRRLRNLRDRLGVQRLAKERLIKTLGNERQAWDVKHEELEMQLEFLEEDTNSKRLTIQEIDARIDQKNRK